MRGAAAALAALLLGGCASAPAGMSRLTLNDPYWARVNVEVVITNRDDCDSRGQGYIAEKRLVMRKNGDQSFDVPNGASICWRHDSNPNWPVAGAWSGWTRATLMPGQSADTDL